MSDKHNILDEQLRKAMEGLEGDVSMSAWDSIENSLNKSDRRKKFFWYFGIASVLVVLTGLVYLLQPTIYNDEVSQTENPTVIKDTDSSQESDNGMESSQKHSQDARETDITTKEYPRTQTQPDAPVTKPGDRASKPVRKGPQSSSNGDTGAHGSDENGDVAGKDSKSGEKSPGKDLPKVEEQDIDKTRITPDPDKIAGTDSIEDAKKVDPKEEVPQEEKVMTPIVKTDSTKDTKKQGPVLGFASPKGGWELGFTFNTGLVRQLIGANPAEEYKLNSRFLGIQEQSIGRSAGFVFKFNAQYYIGKTTFLSTGLKFTQKEENVSYDFVITEGVDLNLTERTITPILWDPSRYQTVKFNNTNTYQFVEIPLRIGKIVNLGSKLELRAETGLSYMLMLNASGQSIDETFLTPVDLSNHQFMKRHVLGFGLKAGLYYTPDNNWRIGIEPGFDRVINSIYSKESAIKVNPYNYGGHITINYLLMNR